VEIGEPFLSEGGYLSTYEGSAGKSSLGAWRGDGWQEKKNPRKNENRSLFDLRDSTHSSHGWSVYREDRGVGAFSSEQQLTFSGCIFGGKG